MWFLLVALPLVTFGSVLAVDITKMVVSAREASNVTEAAAVAGAQQLQQNTWVLDREAAVRVAERTVHYAEDVRAMRSRVVGAAASVSRPHGDYAGERVTVTVDYEVRGLVFMPLLRALTRNTDDYDDASRFTVTRTADVCIPGRYDLTGGSCVRPVP